MACSGCARRRKKISAAYHAVKQGFSAAKRSYRLQTTSRQLHGDSVLSRLAIESGKRSGTFSGAVIDIREKVN